MIAYESPVSIASACPRCGKIPLSGSEHLFFDLNATGVKCQDCHLFGIHGDNQWIDQNLCEDQNVMPHLRVRALIVAGRNKRAAAQFEHGEEIVHANLPDGVRAFPEDDE